MRKIIHIVIGSWVESESIINLFTDIPANLASLGMKQAWKPTGSTCMARYEAKAGLASDLIEVSPRGASKSEE